MSAPEKPRGRPPGTGAVARLRAHMAEGGKLDALVAKTHALALEGDMAAMRLLLERLCPPLRPQAACLEFELPTTGTLTDQANAVLRATATGVLPIDQAARLLAALGSVAHIAEVDELRARLDALQYGDLA